MTTLVRQPSMLIAFLAAASSGAILIAHALGWVTLSYTAAILAPLSLFLFLALWVRAGRGREEVLVNRLVAGVIAGAVGLVGYDLVRLAILLAGVPFNPFRPIEVFGLLILDTYDDTLLTKTVGWAFHFWNGLAFASMYTLALGKGRVLWAVGWGMLLEIAMISTYPSIFRLLIDWPFLAVSMTGHIAYGLGIGFTARRVIR